jgi:hypothetical protein
MDVDPLASARAGRGAVLIDSLLFCFTRLNGDTVLAIYVAKAVLRMVEPLQGNDI